MSKTTSKYTSKNKKVKAKQAVKDQYQTGTAKSLTRNKKKA